MWVLEKTEKSGQKFYFHNLVFPCWSNSGGLGLVKFKTRNDAILFKSKMGLPKNSCKIVKFEKGDE